MNSDNLQQQINERCPCFAKPLSECDCQADEVPVQQGINCDACNRTNLSPSEIYRAYGANFCSDCFDDCVG